MSMSDQLNIAVVGCGYWGVNYVRLLHELAETNVAVVVDQDQSRLDTISRRFPEVPVSTSIDRILETPGIDAVIISTTATSHFKVAKPLLEAGKHLLIEKPMTTEAAEAQILIDTAAQTRAKLMVGHIFLFNPGVDKL